MGYYWFNNCPPEKLEQVSKLCQLAGMNEDECEGGIRQWISDSMGLVRYTPNETCPPLLVQPFESREGKQETIDFLKSMIRLTGTTEVYEDSERKTKLNLAILFS